MEKKYTNFKDFYPYYISEHSHKTTKLLHFIGTTFSLYFLINFFLSFEIKFPKTLARRQETAGMRQKTPDMRQETPALRQKI